MILTRISDDLSDGWENAAHQKKIKKHIHTFEKRILLVFYWARPRRNCYLMGIGPHGVIYSIACMDGVDTYGDEDVRL